MRIGIASRIRGNRIELQAVLADLAEQRPDLDVYGKEDR
jgi:hypothetical protein